jgi:hypothetical protein
MRIPRIAGPAVVLLLLPAARLPAQALPGVRPGATVRVETARDVYAGRMLSLAADTLHVETAPGEAVRVPGLAAKPIVDILAGRPPGSSAAPYVEALVRAGYVHRGEQGIPGGEFFRRGTPRRYRVHPAELDGPVWRDMLRFRDALRADPSAAAAYAELKLGLAARFPRDREAYTGGKGPFVAGVLRRAAEPDRG